MKKTVVIALAALAMLAFGSESQMIGRAQAQVGNCDVGDHIDGSTAATAKQKLQAAGYSQLHGFIKGCDNYWHAQGMKDGNPVNVVLSPQGDVMTEGD
jgi:hypothetical protein